MVKPESEVPDARARVLLFLALLTSEAWRRPAPGRPSPERTAFVLCRHWFDDVYTPGLAYLDGLKGDRSAAEARRFEAAFTQTEREALARFHRFFELRMEMLPERHRRREAFPDNDAWRSLVRHAGALLDALTPEAEALRRTAVRLAEAGPGHGSPDGRAPGAATSPVGPSPRP